MEISYVPGKELGEHGITVNTTRGNYEDRYEQWKRFLKEVRQAMI